MVGFWRELFPCPALQMAAFLLCALWFILGAHMNMEREAINPTGLGPYPYNLIQPSFPPNSPISKYSRTGSQGFHIQIWGDTVRSRAHTQWALVSDCLRVNVTWGMFITLCFSVLCKLRLKVVIILWFYHVE